jgi:hypothetical protein
MRRKKAASSHGQKRHWGWDGGIQRHETRHAQWGSNNHPPVLSTSQTPAPVQAPANAATMHGMHPQRATMAHHSNSTRGSPHSTNRHGGCHKRNRRTGGRRRKKAHYREERRGGTTVNTMRKGEKTVTVGDSPPSRANQVKDWEAKHPEEARRGSFPTASNVRTWLPCFVPTTHLTPPLPIFAVLVAPWEESGGGTCVQWRKERV